MKTRVAVWSMGAVVTLACGSVPEQPVEETVDYEQRAKELAQEIVVLDGHVDVPWRLSERMEDISVRTEKGDFDYPRAIAGGLDVPFMSIYIPASFQESGGARAKADELIDMVEGFEEQWPDKFRIVTSPDEAAAVRGTGIVALPLGMENGAGIEDDLANLQHFYDRGIRYITLTHSENNLICDSSYAEERRWNGLSEFGREVVREMNRLGIIIDVSHISDDTFYQVMEISEAPAIASHSSARAFTPGWERNMSDEMIRLLGEKGGVIQINFGSSFLLDSARSQGEAYWEALQAAAAEKGVSYNSPEMDEFNEAYWAEREKIFADVSDVVAHIDHVVKIAGVDHVGFGSDFDGVGDSLPTGLKDVSYYPNLIRALLEAGYSEEDVEKISSGNVLRVWREVEAVAERLSETM